MTHGQGLAEQVGNAHALRTESGRAELLTELRAQLSTLAHVDAVDADAWTSSGSGWKRVGAYGRASEWCKGLLDRVLATIGLTVISPLLALVALAVKLDSPGPAFFRQTRIGRGGRPFTFWKFRGMFVDARERFPELYDYRYSADEIQTLRFHPGNDPRVTRVGRFIRATSLDELPNLVNVVLGDMSLVGPRPEIPELIPYYQGHAKTVLSVKPGITSLAKCVGRDDLTFSETLELDLRYVRERCLRLDMAILIGTVWKIVAGRLRGH